MAPSRQPTIKRKTSNLSLFGLSRSTSLAPPTGSQSLTAASMMSPAPRSDRRNTSGGLRQFFGNYQAREPEFEVVSLLSQPLASKPPPPMISRLAKSFVDSLSAQQLSNFLTWMLYHELVELPKHPEVWYSLIDFLHIHGWIALGEFLSKCSTSMDTSYGFDLVVLDSICDRLQLQRSTVHSFLIQFADPEKMAFSQIATLINAATAEDKTEVEGLESVQSKLLEFSKLAARIKPTPGSIYDGWHAMIMKRLDDFIQLVIGPRIAHLCSGAPLVTACTSEQLPKEVQDSIRLKYLFEVMQLKRPVPLTCFGIHHAKPPSLELATLPSSPPDKQGAPGLDPHDVERSRNHAIHLMIENSDLRAQVAAIKQDKEELQASNDKLVCKVAKLECIQPSPPVHLSNSATGGLLQSIPLRRSQYGTGAGRRSGVVFSTDQKNLLRAIREATPSPPLESEEEGGEGTPTPSRRRVEW